MTLTEQVAEICRAIVKSLPPETVKFERRDVDNKRFKYTDFVFVPSRPRAAPMIVGVDDNIAGLVVARGAVFEVLARKDNSHLAIVRMLADDVIAGRVFERSRQRNGRVYQVTTVLTHADGTTCRSWTHGGEYLLWGGEKIVEEIKYEPWLSEK